MTIVTQYDVELFQKIEALTGQKMEEYPSEQEAVLLLLERVGEAQRISTMQVCTQLYITTLPDAMTVALVVLLVVLLPMNPREPSASPPCRCAWGSIIQQYGCSASAAAGEPMRAHVCTDFFLTMLPNVMAVVLVLLLVLLLRAHVRPLPIQ